MSNIFDDFDLDIQKNKIGMSPSREEFTQTGSDCMCQTDTCLTYQATCGGCITDGYCTGVCPSLNIASCTCNSFPCTK